VRTCQKQAGLEKNAWHSWGLALDRTPVKESGVKSAKLGRTAVRTACSLSVSAGAVFGLLMLLDIELGKGSESREDIKLLEQVSLVGDWVVDDMIAIVGHR
jgi:hypothetical protein